MNWKSFQERLLPGRRRGADFVLPPVLFEVQPDFVLAARLDLGAGRVRRLGFAPLEAQALSPNPMRPNIAKEEPFMQAIRRVLEVAGDGAGRWGLLISDGAVRAGVVPFETLPEGRRDLEALIRWRLKGILPFPPEEARLSFQVSQVAPAGFEVLAIALRQMVAGQYEALMEQATGRVELVLPAAAALLPLLPEDPATPQLLLHLCSSWLTGIVVGGGRVSFWRAREVARAGGHSPDDAGAAREDALAKNIAREASRVVASTRDHLKIAVGRVWLCQRGLAAPDVASEIAKATSLEVEALTAGDEVAASDLPAAERAILERFGAPLAGLLAN